MIEVEAVEDLLFNDYDDRMRANLSAWLSRNQSYRITSADNERFSSLVAPPVTKRMDYLLNNIAQQGGGLHVPARLTQASISASWSMGGPDVSMLVSLLQEQGKISVSGAKLAISAKGWEHLESLDSDFDNSNCCFVAMHFTPQMFSFYDSAIAPAIRDAGYDPLTVRDRQHNGKIDDMIIAEIRRSKFVVADFSGHRGGVYYEAGFAQGLGKEVIWTCPVDQLGDLHFDVRQYNCIDWSTDAPDVFREKLRLRIESVLGRGRN